MLTEDKVFKYLKKVLDPELHINIVDLGLIYDVKVEGSAVKILMTLTFPGCPLGSVIHEEINKTLGRLPQVKKVDLKITFDPPWDLSKVSSEAKAELGIF